MSAGGRGWGCGWEGLWLGGVCRGGRERRFALHSLQRPPMPRPRFLPLCPSPTNLAGDGIEEDEASAALGWPYIRVLLAPAANYPAHRVDSWRPDAATHGAGLPFTELRVQHMLAAAGLSDAAAAAAESPFSQLPPRGEGRGHLHGSSVALAALAGSSSGQELAGSEDAADGGTPWSGGT